MLKVTARVTSLSEGAQQLQTANGPKLDDQHTLVLRLPYGDSMRVAVSAADMAEFGLSTEVEISIAPKAAS